MNRTETIDIEHQLTVEEFAQKGKKMAEIQKDIDDLFSEKEKNAAAFNAQIKEKDKLLAELGKEIRAGFLLAPTQCDVLMNVPDIGTKSYVSPVNRGVILKSVPMTNNDRQKHIFLQDEQESQG